MFGDDINKLVFEIKLQVSNLLEFVIAHKINYKFLIYDLPDK